MIEIAIVLVLSSVLVIMAYEFSAYRTRKWGENARSFF